jgi:hypothetical protein
MTLLQLFVFLHLQLIFSHFDGVFSLFMGNEQVFGAFDNFLPLSPRKSGVHTFLQKSHLFEISVRANKNLTYGEKIGIVKVGNITKYNQLLLADYSAYTIRMAF